MVSTCTSENLSDYAAAEQPAELTYVLTEKGWMLEEWDEEKQSKVYYNTLTAYSDYLLSQMSAVDLQDKTSYYNEKILLELASKYLTEEQLQKYEEKYGALIGKAPAYQTAYEKIDSGTLTGYADTDHSEGREPNALDGNRSTYWHNNYSPNTTNMEEGSERDNGYTILLSKNTDIGKLEYLPRQDSSNGRILEFEIYYSETADGDDFRKVQLENSQWANDYNLKYVEFDAPNARRIRMEARASEGTEKNKFITAAEFYLYEKYKNYTNTRDIYLSNLHRSYQEEEIKTPQMDKNAAGNNITLKVDGAEKTFKKGVGLLGNATIVYDFTNRTFDYFTAYVGMEAGQDEKATANVSFYGMMN